MGWVTDSKRARPAQVSGARTLVVIGVVGCCGLTGGCVHPSFTGSDPRPPTPAPGPRVIYTGTGSRAALSVSGHVRTSTGAPAVGITIEFIDPTGEAVQQWRTDSAGFYAGVLPAGEYNATCLTKQSVRCGVRGGTGSQYSVTVPPNWQTVDFVVCPANRYPGCLRR